MLLLGGRECQKLVRSLLTSMATVKTQLKKTQEPKVHINEATLKVMGQAAKDFSYTEQEFVEAVEMYQYFCNQNLEDVPIPNSQD